MVQEKMVEEKKAKDAPAKLTKAMLKVTQVKSIIGTRESHRACVRGLGLRTFFCYLGFFCHQRFHAGNVAAHFEQLAVITQLLGGRLHTQPELRAGQGQQFLPQIRNGFCSKFTGLHGYAPTCLITNEVAIGSLAEAKRNASRATTSSTPSISYSILPGRISAT